MSQQPTRQYGPQESSGQPSRTGAQSHQPGQAQQTGGGGQQFGQPPQFGGGGQAGQPGQQPGGMTQQPGATTQQPGGGRNVTLEEGISDEMRVALHDFVQSATVCEWCSEQCIDEGAQMAECVRLCRDVADLATLNIQLLARDSVFGPEAAEIFASAAEACAQECSRHSHKHCQECAEVLTRAARSTRKMLSSLGAGQGQQGMGPRAGGQY